VYRGRLGRRYAEVVLVVQSHYAIVTTD